MDKSKSTQYTPFGKFLAAAGFVAAFLAMLQNTNEFIPSLIAGLIVAGLGGFVGDVLWRVLVVVIAIAIAVGSAYVRMEVTRAVLSELDGGPRPVIVTLEKAVPSGAVKRPVHRDIHWT